MPQKLKKEAILQKKYNAKKQHYTNILGLENKRSSIMSIMYTILFIFVIYMECLLNSFDSVFDRPLSSKQEMTKTNEAGLESTAI